MSLHARKEPVRRSTHSTLVDEAIRGGYLAPDSRQS
jgi:hypothetical protein